MAILEVATNKTRRATVALLEQEDLKKIKKARYFFDWKTEAQTNTAYKLTLTGEDDIKGLMSIVDHPGEQRIEIRLLAVSKENVIMAKEKGTKQKEYDGIAGNLIAQACRLAVTKYGENACVSLVPKTELRQYYKSAYGFMDASQSVFLEGEPLYRLIDIYNP